MLKIGFVSIKNIFVQNTKKEEKSVMKPQIPMYEYLFNAIVLH